MQLKKEVETVKLREVAHSRTGDKGNISNVSLIVYDSKDYEWIKEYITADRVKSWFHTVVKGDVIRYELPKLGALNFVMHDALGGGVTKSLSLDMHGKSLSSWLLEMEFEK